MKSSIDVRIYQTHNFKTKTRFAIFGYRDDCLKAKSLLKLKISGKPHHLNVKEEHECYNYCNSTANKTFTGNEHDDKENIHGFAKNNIQSGEAFHIPSCYVISSLKPMNSPLKSRSQENSSKTPPQQQEEQETLCQMTIHYWPQWNKHKHSSKQYNYAIQCNDYTNGYYPFTPSYLTSNKADISKSILVENVSERNFSIIQDMLLKPFDSFSVSQLKKSHEVLYLFSTQFQSAVDAALFVRRLELLVGMQNAVYYLQETYQLIGKKNALSTTHINRNKHDQVPMGVSGGTLLIRGLSSITLCTALHAACQYDGIVTIWKKPAACGIFLLEIMLKSSEDREHCANQINFDIGRLSSVGRSKTEDIVEYVESTFELARI